MRIIRAVLLISIAAALTSCGYSTNGTGALRGGSEAQYRSIAIPMFTNDTYEPLIEREVTSAMKDEVIYDGRLALRDASDADLLLQGRILQFELQPLTYDPAERIQEYRIRIMAEIKVSERGKEGLLWKDSRLESFADYRVTQDVTKSKINKLEAIKKASKNLAEKFIIRVLDIM